MKQFLKPKLNLIRMVNSESTECTILFEAQMIPLLQYNLLGSYNTVRKKLIMLNNDAKLIIHNDIGSIETAYSIVDDYWYDIIYNLFYEQK